MVGVVGDGDADGSTPDRDLLLVDVVDHDRRRGGVARWATTGADRMGPVETGVLMRHVHVRVRI